MSEQSKIEFEAAYCKAVDSGWTSTKDLARQIWQKARSLPVGVPDGYALVPVEPTLEMLEAAWNYHGSPAAPTVKAEQVDKAGMHTLDAICDLFMIGRNARTHACVMVNIENTKRFADLLHAIESEFFMVPCEPDENNEPDDEPQYECLLSCWGSTQEQYIEQFREALKKIAAPSLPAAGCFGDSDEHAALHQLAFELGGTDDGEYLLDADDLDKLIAAAISAQQSAPDAPERVSVPEGWRIVEKPTCFALLDGNQVVATLAGPEAEENAAIIAALLASHGRGEA